MIKRLLALATILMLFLTACGDDSGSGTAQDTPANLDTEEPKDEDEDEDEPIPGGLSPAAEDAAGIFTAMLHTDEEGDECVSSTLEKSNLFAEVSEIDEDDDLLGAAFSEAAEEGCFEEDEVGTFAVDAILADFDDVTEEEATCLSDGMQSLDADHLTQLILLADEGTEDFLELSPDAISAVFSLLGDCGFGRFLAEEILQDASFSQASITDEQALCFADEVLALDGEILIGLASEDEPSDDAILAVLDLLVECDLGDILTEAVAAEAAFGGTTLTDEQASCFTSAILELEDELLLELLREPDDLDPEQLAPLLSAMADCDLGSALAAEIAVDLGITEEEAACFMNELLADTELMQVFISLESSGEEPSAEVIQDLLAIYDTCGIDPLTL